jgi:hypothetical protein
MRRTALLRFRVVAALIVGGLTALPALAQAPGNFTTLQASGTATLNGNTLICSGRPWIDVRCNGATGDDGHDDTSAFTATIAAAVTGSAPYWEKGMSRARAIQ